MVTGAACFRKMNKNELNRVDDNPEKMKNSGAKKM
jgi:hypothetical protein